MTISNLKYGAAVSAFVATTMATQAGGHTVDIAELQHHNLFNGHSGFSHVNHDFLGNNHHHFFNGHLGFSNSVHHHTETNFAKQFITETFGTTYSFEAPSQDKIDAYHEARQAAEAQRAAEISENFAVDYDSENGTGVVHFDTGMQSQTGVRSEHVAGNVFITETEGFEPTATIHMALDTQRFTLTQVEADPREQFSVGDIVLPDQIDISENANVKILTAAETLGTDTPRAQEAHFAIGFPPQGDEQVLLTVYDRETGNPIEQIDMSEFIDTNANDHLVLVVKEEGHQEVLQLVMHHLQNGNQFEIEAQSQLGRQVVTHRFNAGDTLTADLNMAGQALDSRNHSFTYDLVADVQHTITYDIAAEPLDSEYFATCEFINVPSHLSDDEVTYRPAHTIATSGIMPRSPDQAVVATLSNDPSIVLAAGVIGYVGASQQYGYGFDRAPNAVNATYSNHGEAGFYMQNSMPVGGCTGEHENRITSDVPQPVRPGMEHLITGYTTQTIGGVTHTTGTITGTTPWIIPTGTPNPNPNPNPIPTPNPVPIGELEQHIVDGAAALDRATGFTNFEKPVHAFLDHPLVNINGSFGFLASGLIGLGLVARRRKTASEGPKVPAIA